MAPGESSHPYTLCFILNRLHWEVTDTTVGHHGDTMSSIPASRLQGHQVQVNCLHVVYVNVGSLWVLKFLPEYSFLKLDWLRENTPASQWVFRDGLWVHYGSWTGWVSQVEWVVQPSFGIFQQVGASELQGPSLMDVGFLWGHWFPPTSQKLARRCTGYDKLPVRMNGFFFFFLNICFNCAITL